MTRAIFTKELMRDFTVLHVSLSGPRPSWWMESALTAAREVKTGKEEAYFFRMSKYAPQADRVH